MPNSTASSQTATVCIAALWAHPPAAKLRLSIKLMFDRPLFRHCYMMQQDVEHFHTPIRMLEHDMLSNSPRTCACDGLQSCCPATLLVGALYVRTLNRPR